MSAARKAFAEAVHGSEEAWYVVASGIHLVHSDKDIATMRAQAVNDAVASERRKAAAEALRSAAKKWPKGKGRFDSGDFGAWLEAEAAALAQGFQP